MQKSRNQGQRTFVSGPRPAEKLPKLQASHAYAHIRTHMYISISLRQRTALTSTARARTLCVMPLNRLLQDIELCPSMSILTKVCSGLWLDHCRERTFWDAIFLTNIGHFRQTLDQRNRARVKRKTQDARPRGNRSKA